MKTLCRIELHHFSDASTTAYRSACYLRVVNQKGQVGCNLLFSRLRVAPLKQISIPRLELAAAALSVQQDDMMRRELSIAVDANFFWTDSTIVLAYIRNEQRRSHTYVGNRVAVIHAGSSVGQCNGSTFRQNQTPQMTSRKESACLILSIGTNGFMGQSSCPSKQSEKR